MAMPATSYTPRKAVEIETITITPQMAEKYLQEDLSNPMRKNRPLAVEKFGSTLMHMGQHGNPRPRL